MLPGFNHNIRHDGLLFHVQTEDNGLKIARIVTQVFIDGHLLAIERSDYAELRDQDLPAEARDTQIRHLMQTQHKRQLRRVTTGEFKAQVEAYENRSDGDLETNLESPTDGPSVDTSSLPEIEFPPEAQHDETFFDSFLSSVDKEMERFSEHLPPVSSTFNAAHEPPEPKKPEPDLSHRSRRRRSPASRARRPALPAPSAAQAEPNRQAAVERVRRMRRRPSMEASSSNLPPPDQTMLEMDATALRASLREQRARLRGEDTNTQPIEETADASLDSVLLQYLNDKPNS